MKGDFTRTVRNTPGNQEYKNASSKFCQDMNIGVKFKCCTICIQKQNVSAKFNYSKDLT